MDKKTCLLKYQQDVPAAFGGGDISVLFFNEYDYPYTYWRIKGEHP